MSTVAAVVVNHQYGAYLPDAVESLLSQEPPFDEVVVVDDGSTDDSLQVLEAYRDRVRVVAKENGGQLSACLAGLATCSSDYVYFLDADDLAAPGLVAALQPVLAQAPVKVQFPVRAVDGDLVPLDSVFPTVPPGYDARAMVEDNRRTGFYLCPPTSGNVFRRATLQALDLASVDPREFIDGPPALVLPHLGEVVSLQEPLALYRVHGKNHSLTSAGLPDLLRKECVRFDVRWVQASRLLGLAQPPVDPLPGYLLERRLMLAALGEGGPVAPLALRYAARCRGLHAPASHRLVFALWALLLLVPLRPLRRQVVQLRRSAVGRPALVRAAVRLVRRGSA